VTAGRLPALLFDALPGESLRQRVLRFVRDTVATARDVAEALGIPIQSACEALAKLTVCGSLSCQRVRVPRRRISVLVYWGAPALQWGAP
jgi:predicted Rossmann fold nucleotide-binding protein DprA/Smf involved in DNA uptake